MLLTQNVSPELDALLRYRGDPRGIAADGAMGRNRGSFSDVAAQRDALWTLRYAIRARRIEDARRAVDALDYAFRRRDEAGYFENGLGVDPVRAIEADAFFLAAYGQFRRLAEQSAGRDELMQRLKSHEPAVRAGIGWLMKNQEALVEQGKETPNRLLFDALALLLNGQALGDTAAVQAGTAFFQRAIAMQHSDGYFLEKRGYDSSYQAVCLLNLAAIYSYVDDPEIASRSFASAAAGLRWLGTRIGVDGEVSVQGNTRTGAGQETFFGRAKDVNYPEVIYALFLWSALDNGDHTSQAERVARHMRDLLAKR
jgi:hypothetical protein